MIIYHKNCNDGLCAAAIVSYVLPFPSPTFAVAAGEVDTVELPSRDPSDHTIWLVDLSATQETVDRWLASGYARVVMMDHHKLRPGVSLESRPGYECVYDKNRSGAKIVADYFAVDHWIIDYVQDRDLWTWTLPDSKAINAWLQMQSPTVDRWEELITLNDKWLPEIAATGTALLKQQLSVVKLQAESMQIIGESAVLVCTAFVSETCDYILATYPEVKVVKAANGKTVNLRSRGDFDCAAYCQNKGGGGHVPAAGYPWPIDLKDI